MCYEAPRTPAETALAAIWGEVFRTARIGVEDNFFDIGGDSVVALRMVARIRAVLGVELDPRTLFEAQTISACAVIVEQRLMDEVDAMSDDELDQAMRHLSGGDGDGRG